MSASIKAPRRPLSRLDRAIIALHGVVAAVFGIIGFLEADDPGWRDVQRLVIVMLVGLWVSGIVVVGVLARLVGKRFAGHGGALAERHPSILELSDRLQHHGARAQLATRELHRARRSVGGGQRATALHEAQLGDVLSRLVGGT